MRLTVVKILVTTTVLAYLATKVNWYDLQLKLIFADKPWFIAALIGAGLSLFTAAIRWQLLLRVQKINISLFSAAYLTLIGQFFNAFLFGTTGGDAVKVSYMLRHAPNHRSKVVLSILLDRVIGLLGFLMCSIVALPWEMTRFIQHEHGRVIAYSLLVMLTVSIFLVALLFFAPFHRMPDAILKLWRKIPMRHVLHNMLFAFRAHGQDKKLTASAFTFSIVTCLLVFAVAYCLGMAIRLEVTYIQIVLCISIVTCAISLPISVGGHGVREGSFIFMFSLLGIVSRESSSMSQVDIAVLFSLLYFVVYLLYGLIGGIIYTIFRHEHIL